MIIALFILRKSAQICTIFETAFLLRRPSTGGAGRSAQTAQKEVGLARRRGGGVSARFGGREGVDTLHQKPPDGRALSRCIRRARRQKHARMALAASGWGYDIEVLRGGRHGRE